MQRSLSLEKEPWSLHVDPKATQKPSGVKEDAGLTPLLGTALKKFFVLREPVQIFLWRQKMLTDLW